MIAHTFLIAALGVEAVFAAPNLADRWTRATAPLDGTSDNSTNATSTNGTSTNGTVPSGETTGINDTQILQFALNLEHIESAFYNLGLSQFNDSAFQAAGFAPEIRGRFAQIAEHEATHVQLLESILGADAPQPCNYTFPFTDPVSYAALAFALESTGESAYLGASTIIQNKTALGVAGTILAVEIRHASWLGSQVLNSTPWNGPFDTPLNASAIFSIASQFIVACPSSNPPLPVVPLPVLTISPTNASVDQNITVSLTGQNGFNASNIPITNASFVAPTANGSAPFYLAYYHGFNISYSEVSLTDNTTMIPDGLAGVVYTSLVSSNDSIPSVGTTLSGLAVLNFPVSASANNSFN